MKVLSLGAGVQSSTVLLMSCKGVLPKLDAAIFADTQWEPKAVYDWLGFLLAEAKKAGIPMWTVTKGNLRNHFLEVTQRNKADGKNAASIPAYTLVDGQLGQLPRNCTADYKITPIQQWLRKHRKDNERIELWFGISADEQRRMRYSKIAWIEHYYPLVFGLPKPFKRHDCQQWLKDNGYPEAPRSACIGCPYRSDKEWRNLKGADWHEAVSFDDAIRNPTGNRFLGQLYLHRSGKPLKNVDLSTMEELGQTNWLQECEGMCGV